MKHTYTTPFTLRWLIPLLGLQLPLCAHAQIKTDGSVGPAAQTVVGPKYVIPQTLGQLAGSNLFHSFQTFNINTGESANFTTSTAGINNVISRVTGGGASNINGTLSLTAASSTPAFFFINPAGVTFGAGAVVDVPASFHVSTAQQLKFANGFIWGTASPGSSALTVAAPESFGFLGGTNALSKVSLNNLNASGAVGAALMRLNLKAGSTFDVSAGAIDIQSAVVAAPAGAITLYSTGGDTTSISLTAPNSMNLTGSISISDATVKTNGNGGGRVVLNGGQVSLFNGSQISAINTGKINAASNSGVFVFANNLIIDNSARSPYSSQILTAAQDLGNAGNISIIARDQITLSNGGSIDSKSFNPFTNLIGNSGNILVQAARLTIDSGTSADATGITSESVSSNGNAGNIAVHVTEPLNILGTGSIDSSSNAGVGNAGDISITAGGLKMDSTAIFPNDRTASISTEARTIPEYAGPSGHAGNISIAVTGGKVELLGSAGITSGGNQPGSIQIHADQLVIDARGGLFKPAQLNSSAVFGSGRAGDITVMVAGTVALLNGGIINSDTSGSSAAGNISIISNGLKIDEMGSLYETGIFSDTTGAGTAGNIAIQTSGTIEIRNGGRISSSTYSSGNAGSVKTSAASLLVDGTFSRISAQADTGSSGQTGSVSAIASDSITLSNGGNISIQNDTTANKPSSITPTLLSATAPAIILTQAAQITAQSTGSIPASNITVTADKLLLNTSRITTSANEGNGGAITVNGSGVLLNNSQITTSVSGTRGDGGNIAVHAAALALNTGFIQANTAANNAKGGNVTIDVKALAPSAGNSLFLGGNTPYTFKSGQFGYNVIQAAAPTGLNGEIHTTALAIDISGALAGLGAPALDAGGMARNPCRIGGGSSFAKSGRGGFAPSARRALVPLLAVLGETASALPAALDQQLVSAPLDCGKS